MSNIERDQLADFASDRAADWQQTAMGLRDLHKLALAENKALAEQLRGVVEALYTAHDFIGRVSKWTGDTEDEQAEVLAEITRHLPQGGSRR